MTIVRLTLGSLAWSVAAALLVSSAPRTYSAVASAGVGTPADVWVTTGAEALGLLLLAWLALLAVVTALEATPGRLGRAARWATRCIAPALVSSLVRGGLGLGAGAAFGTSSVLAMTSLTPAVSATADHPWPSLDRVEAAASTHHRPYVVRPGDSLWAIAERQLSAAGAHATSADVARAWPAWWAVNRDVVGDDPNLIHPGQRLHAPRVHA
jgi:hypothetical protein